MDIRSHFTPATVLVLDRTQDKWTLIGQLVDAAVAGAREAGRSQLDRAAVLKAVTERERRGATAMGHGLALPHARIAGLHGVEIALATLRAGLPSEAQDRLPVRVACLVLTPENQPTLAIKVYARISEALGEPGRAEALLAAADAAAAAAVLRGFDLEFGVTLTARDIMRPPLVSARPDTPIREVTHAMMRHREESAAVTEPDGRFVGEINCDTLFRYGMPDFFAQLKTVAFIPHFDPFEKYFRCEAHSTAKDLVSADCIRLPPTATLIEVVFALVVKRAAQVFVVENGKLLGVVDRSIVLDEIVNF